MKPREWRQNLKDGDYIHSTFGAEFVIEQALFEKVARCTKQGKTELGGDKIYYVGQLIIPDLIVDSWKLGKSPNLSKE